MKAIIRTLALCAILPVISCATAKQPQTDALAASPESALTTMNPSVAQVVSGGLWREGGKSGHYRLIAACGGWEEVSCAFFLQWLQEPGEPEKDPVVVASIEVQELTNQSFYKAALSITDSTMPQCIITVVGTNPADEKIAIALKPAGIGKYAVEKLPSN